jgi:hypothetical protein
LIRENRRIMTGNTSEFWQALCPTGRKKETIVSLFFSRVLRPSPLYSSPKLTESNSKYMLQQSV